MLEGNKFVSKYSADSGVHDLVNFIFLIIFENFSTWAQMLLETKNWIRILKLNLYSSRHFYKIYLHRIVDSRFSARTFRKF